MRWIKQSLRRQLMLLIPLSLLIPSLLSLYINYQFTKDSLYDQAIEETTTLLDRGSDDLAGYLDDLNQVSLSVYADDDFYNILLGKASTIGSGEYYNKLYDMTRVVREIRQIYLYQASSNRSFLIVGGSMKQGYGRAEAPPANLQPYDFVIQNVHRSGDYGIRQTPNPKSVPVFTLQRSIYLVPTDEVVGWLSIDVAPDELNRIFRNLDGNLPGDLFIYKQSKEGLGAVFYESLPEDANSSFNETVMRRLVGLSDGAGSFAMKEDGFDGLLFYRTVQFGNQSFVMAKRISEHALYAKAERITLINSGIALFFLAVSIGVVLAVSFNIFSPIGRLIRHMSRIQNGQFSATINLGQQDEIGALANRFQTMMDTINEMIEREYAIKMANQRSEIKALQSQINPHFLNNALQSIGSVALEAQIPRVYTLISSLGQMMYYNMRNKEELVALAEEEGYARHYLMLQEQRHQGRFRYEIDSDPTARMLLLPKMTLQPVVENYFEHNQRIKDGELGICTRLYDGEFHLIVRDNGAGMREDKAAWLEGDLNAIREIGESIGDSIGLRNVMSRLRYYYGHEVHIRLQSLKPQGFAVTLIIPTSQLREGSA
ncbi:sensor histidine kinase [Cohnella fermenti]|uniref:HAMP domain-containing protein n=1 Tax=Cohnella fermenti TaxID=2565925 RepID=A0A4S4C4J5_9BACL|nr:histidine kinase [Cohnella fermenti]THF82119.1 HAMP domain-containing protein [Cohnella fermenti]